MNTRYIDLKERTQTTLYDYFLGLIIKARETAKIPTNKGFYDEDANVYLAGVLAAYADGRYLESLRHVLARYDFLVFKKIERCLDNYTNYFVYKCNADDMLVRLGMFTYHGMDAKMLEKVLYRIRIYYSIAAHYHCAMYRARTASAHAMETLAQWPQRYAFILSELRHNYCAIVGTVTCREFKGFLEEIERYGKKDVPYKNLVDEFLDTFLLCQRTKDKGVLEGKLCSLSATIKELDPHFAWAP
jgi:hypothetical protein